MCCLYGFVGCAEAPCARDPPQPFTRPVSEMRIWQSGGSSTRGRTRIFEGRNFPRQWEAPEFLDRVILWNVNFGRILMAVSKMEVSRLGTAQEMSMKIAQSLLEV